MGRRRRRGAAAGAPASGSPAWMMTYGDLVTQLLAFFVLLFTFSTIDAQKFREALISLRGALGVFPGGASITTGPREMPTTDPKDSPVPSKQQLESVYARVQAALAQQGDSETELELELDEPGQRLIIRYRDQALFDSGRAEIRAEAIPRLLTVAMVLAELPNPIRIEGHTDNVPIRTLVFPSNWELSTHRAMAVVRLFHDEFGIDPRRLEGAGAGEWYPVAPNDTPAGRARNRRVDVIVLAASEGTDH